MLNLISENSPAKLLILHSFMTNIYKIKLFSGYFLQRKRPGFQSSSADKLLMTANHKLEVVYTAFSHTARMGWGARSSFIYYKGKSGEHTAAQGGVSHGLNPNQKIETVC